MMGIQFAPLAHIAPSDAYSRADVEAIARVLDRAGTLRLNVNRHGLFPAVSATHAAAARYQYVWIRDNIMIASYLVETRRPDEAWRTVSAIGQYLAAHRDRFDAIIEHRADRSDAMMRPHVRFDGETLSELAEDWPHAQNDALGYFLWLICRLIGHGFEAPDPIAALIARFPAYFEAIAYWQDPDAGHWEEDVEVHNSSVGTVVAGLRALQRVLERPVHRAFHDTDPAAVARLIARGEAHLASLPVESDSRPMDAALLFLVYPLDAVTRAQADGILRNATGPLRGDFGIRRYLGDSYWGPGYKTAFSEIDRTKNFSNDLSVRNRLIPRERQGQVEAQWCIFDPILPVLVCIVATLIMIQRDRTVRGIASYLMVFHEEKHGAEKWERALHHIRTADSTPLKALQKDIWLGETSTRAFVPLGIVLLSLYLRGLHKQPWPLPDMMLFGACVAIQAWLAWVWRRVFLKGEVENAVTMWKQVESALPPSGHPASTTTAAVPRTPPSLRLASIDALAVRPSC